MPRCQSSRISNRPCAGTESFLYIAPAQRPGGEAPADPLQAIDATWSVIVARDLRPIGVRLALRRAVSSAIALTDVLVAVISGFERDASAPFPRGLVVLAPLGFAFDDELAQWTPPRNVLLEVGADELDVEGRIESLRDVQRNGVRMVLRSEGRELPRAAMPLFQYTLAGTRDRSALPSGAGWLAVGADTRAAADRIFAAGAHALVGWPLNDFVPEAPGSLQPSQKTVLELVRLLQADADLPDIERAFHAEPVLSYLLLTLANSPAFRRGTPVGSLAHAISLLGTKRLLKWLVLLLVIASKGSRALPQIHAAVARGFFMENLAEAMGAFGVRDDCFIVGAFSLLDRITGLSIDELFSSVTLPAVVVDALRSSTGPLAGHFALARAVEDEADRARDAANALGAQRAEVNGALLQALAATDALQSLV